MRFTFILIIFFFFLSHLFPIIIIIVSVAAAILGTYTTLIVLWRVKAAISKKPKEETSEVTEEALTA
jgi:membrane associated rhomboid family serine protease